MIRDVRIYSIYCYLTCFSRINYVLDFFLIIVLKYTAAFTFHQGAIFKEPLTAYEVSNFWTVSFRYSFTELFQTADHLNDITNATIKHAHENSSGLYSKEEVDTLLRLRSDTTHLVTTLYYLMPSSQKRGLFDLGGTILQYTLGTAKDTDVQDLITRVSTLEAQDKEASMNLLDNLSILNETSARSFRNREQLAKLQLISTELASTLQNTSTILQNRLQIVSNQFHIFLTFQLISEAYTELHTQLSDHILALRQLSKGFLSPTFFPPEFIIQSLTNISKALPYPLETLYLPSLQFLDHWYSVIDIHAVISGPGNLHLLLHFPLKRISEYFQIYSVQTFPVPVQNSSNLFRTIHLEHSFFILSHDQQSYRSIASLQDVNFKTLHDGSNVIRFSQPRFHVNRPNCLLNLFFNRNDSLEAVCDITIHKLLEPYFSYLDVNRYFYVMPAQEQIKWTCPSIINIKNFPTSLRGHGTLSVPPLCSCQILDVILTSSFSKKTDAPVLVEHFLFTAPAPAVLSNNSLPPGHVTALLDQLIEDSSPSLQDEAQTGVRLQRLQGRIRNEVELHSGKMVRAATDYTIGTVTLILVVSAIGGAVLCIRSRRSLHHTIRSTEKTMADSIVRQAERLEEVRTVPSEELLTKLLAKLPIAPIVRPPLPALPPPASGTRRPDPPDPRPSSYLQISVVS